MKAVLFPEVKKVEIKEELKALIFDSHFDSYRGIMVYIRVFNGTIKKNDIIEMIAIKKSFEILEVGIFSAIRGVLSRSGFNRVSEYFLIKSPVGRTTNIGAGL